MPVKEPDTEIEFDGTGARWYSISMVSAGQGELGVAVILDSSPSGGSPLSDSPSGETPKDLSPSGCTVSDMRFCRKGIGSIEGAIVAEKPIAFPRKRIEFEDFDDPEAFETTGLSGTARCWMSSSNQALAERMVCVRCESFQPRISASRNVPNIDQATAINAPSSPSAIMSSIKVNAERILFIMDFHQPCVSRGFYSLVVSKSRCCLHRPLILRFAVDERDEKVGTMVRSPRSITKHSLQRVQP